MIYYSAAMNDAIALAKKLEREHESEHLATKADLARLEAKLETSLAQMETKLETSLAQMESKLAQLQVKLMTWTTVLAGIIIAVLKLT